MIKTESLSTQEKQIFTEYLQNHFTERMDNSNEDLTFLEFWQEIIEDSAAERISELINKRIVPKRPVEFKEPENISIKMYESTAGKIPVIELKNTEDFENLITNLVHKGVRPENISSTGASFIFGKTTRFIILSNKPYSNVTAKTLGLEEKDWKEKSMQIRLEHECTHFYTKKTFGVAKNHLHDELMADFFGLYSAFGFYKAEYFEYFMGIKGTEGSRLKCYIPECSPELFEVLKQTASEAAKRLEKWSLSEVFLAMSKNQRIEYLCGRNLSELLSF